MKMEKNVGTEERILEVAYAHFLSRGYKHTTMDDIAQALGMSKKTLYKHFSGKLELLAAAFERLKTRLSLKVEALLETEEMRFTGKLKAMLRVIAADLAPINPELLADLREHAPEVWAALQDYVRQSGYLRFSRLIEEGIRQGRVKEDINQSLVVLLYASAIQNLIDPKFLSQFPREMREDLAISTAEIYDQAISIIYQGILTEEGRQELRD